MSEQCDIKHASGWGTGIPYMGWVVTNLLGNDAKVSVVIAQHSIGCREDHGSARFIFAEPGFMQYDAYGKICDMGYFGWSLLRFSQFTGADEVIGRLRLTEIDGHDPICLCFDLPAGREFSESEEHREREAFGCDPLSIPAVIGTVMGPFPRVDDTSPIIDEQTLDDLGSRRPS